MRGIPPPLSKDVVLIGGGHTHALFLRSWGMSPIEGVRLTVINPAATAPYTGMLPGFVAGHYTREELDIDLVRLSRFAGARIIVGAVNAIDRNRRRISVFERPDIAYDIASIDIGITSNMAELKGYNEHAVSAKPLGIFANRWEKLVSSEQKNSIVVIGGGVAGVELALAMRYRLGLDTTLSIVEKRRCLEGVTGHTRGTLLTELSRAKIAVYENVAPAEITEFSVILSDGSEIPSSFTVGAAGATPYRWLEKTELALTDGYIDVKPTLKTSTDPSIYAVGDCAHFLHAPRPKAGVFAVRAAPVLFENVVADLTDGDAKRFYPQSKFLKLISLGRKSAIADKYAVAPSGSWAWSWKDHIDRAFMRRLNELPVMSPPKQSRRVSPSNESVESLCGGCGAKVSGDLLSQVLKGLEGKGRDDVERGIGDDAAILKPTGHSQVITTDHLRAFWDDPYLMTRIAAVHALNDVLAMGAEPQSLLAQVTLPDMVDRLVEPTLLECMSAAHEIAIEAGAALVGGHTAKGAELSIGFTATGVLPTSPLTLDGAREGDVVVLTRPIGSGTILAAEMRGLASGRAVIECLRTMSKLDLTLASKLATTATAMTDVTGFGLAGHAAQIAEASRITIEINLVDVPCYESAESLAEMGVRSTIYPANLRMAPLTEAPFGKSVLLFDPQTAGGFLATVPAAKVSFLDGVQVIGRCLPRGSTSLTVV